MYLFKIFIYLLEFSLSISLFLSCRVVVLYAHVRAIMFLTCFLSHSNDRVTDCTPNRIVCCHSDGVVAVLLQLCYGVTSTATTDSCIAFIHIRTLS